MRLNLLEKARMTAIGIALSIKLVLNDLTSLSAHRIYQCKGSRSSSTRTTTRSFAEPRKFMEKVKHEFLSTIREGFVIKLMATFHPGKSRFHTGIFISPLSRCLVLLTSSAYSTTSQKEIAMSPTTENDKISDYL